MLAAMPGPERRGRDSLPAPGSSIVIELAESPDRARELASGGVFVAGCTLALNDDCELHVIGERELRLPGRIVFVDGRGAGIELVGFTSALKQELAALAAPAPAEAALDEADGSADEVSKIADPKQREFAMTMHQRLRRLTLAEAVKKAMSPDPTERMLLERMYGKNVWEALLRNTRLTAPEVARLARMGTLPRVQLENIINNGAWLQIPEVRRALLTNPRLGTDQIMRVLRLMPKHELKVAANTAAYTFAVRDVAKRMIRDD